MGRISQEAPSLPKRIIVLCDGTWQSATSLKPNSGVSNVTRLCRVLARAGVDKDNKVFQQVVYYDAGVGTGEITNFERTRQGGLGIGLAENVIEAYNFIANNYSEGDELFFFGFSRGAYTVRAAAGIVADIGVLKPAGLPHFITHYNDYINSGHKPQSSLSAFEPWKNYAKEHTECLIAPAEKVTIQVIGVWDTVGSLGIPDIGHFWKLYKADQSIYQFYNTDLSDRVKHAYQALALDERRHAFSPSLWKVKDESSTKLVQCWFPGAHINVGGGSSSDTDANLKEEQLAFLALKQANENNQSKQDSSKLFRKNLSTDSWMLDRIHSHLAFSQTAIEEQFKPFDILSDTKTPVTSSHSSHMLWRTAKRKTLPAGYAKGKIKNSFTLAYWLLGNPVNRTPNAYHDRKSGWRTNERIHPSVYYRQLSNAKHGQEIYQPAAMKGWVREYEKDGIDEKGQRVQGWMWRKYRDDSKEEVENQMWEFEIGHMELKDSLEYRLIENSWVESIHREVMEGWNLEPDTLIG